MGRGKDEKEEEVEKKRKVGANDMKLEDQFRYPYIS